MKTTVTPPSITRQKQKQPSRAQAGFAFGIVVLINILNYMDRTILSAVLPYVKTEFQLSYTEVGLLTSSFLLIYAIATLPLGVWADRGIRKNIIAICAGIWSIATGLAGFTHNFMQMLITRSFLGIGEAGYAPASLSLIGDLFHKEERGRILSIWSVTNLIGTALGLTLGGIVAYKFGWRWAFYMVGVPGLIAAFLIWRSYDPPRGIFDRAEGQAGQQVEQNSKKATKSHIKEAPQAKNIKNWILIFERIKNGFLSFIRELQHFLHISTYRVLLIAFIFSFFIIGAAQVWIPIYLVGTFHLNTAQSGPLSGGLLAGGSLIGTLMGGWLADTLQRRFPQGRMLVSTLAFLVGAPLTLIALSLHALVPFAILFALAIICLSLCLGPLNAIIQDIITPAQRATGVGLILLLAHLFGDVTSNLVIGFIADRLSLGTTLRIITPTCLLIAGLACLIGIRTIAKDMQNMQKTLESQQAAEGTASLEGRGQ